MFKLEFYVPQESVDSVKSALFKVGAGKYKKYDMCSWESLGTGQFRPLSGSNPYIGETGTLEKVDELKVEMICEDTVVKNVIDTLVENHPYEEPAYSLLRIVTPQDL